MKIATVCGMGFGTSMMLAMQVRQLVADEGVQASVDPVDLASFKSMHADIVVAPRDMADQVSEGAAQHVILIDNLVDRDEVNTKVLDAVRSFSS
ncbi:PTS sugar transporter subunit IIB [Isoptericola halotolerans]|uniref:PTS sugar transporter subunit IIB n=1 Tax=Isoptericola halotolerans TaxID=300560 RepID=UPI00388CFEBA